MMDGKCTRHWSAHGIALAWLFPATRVCYYIPERVLLICGRHKFHLHWDPFAVIWLCERISVRLRTNPRTFVKLHFLSYPAWSQNEDLWFLPLSSVSICWTWGECPVPGEWEWKGSFGGTEPLKSQAWQGMLRPPAWHRNSRSWDQMEQQEVKTLVSLSYSESWGFFK